jgi:lysophospholipase L1-like esterase
VNSLSKWSQIGLISLLLGTRLCAQPVAAPLQTLPSAPSTRALGQTIAASDPRFSYEGRFDFSDPNGVAVIWQASRIALDFEGDSIDLQFDAVKGQCFFNAGVDGTNTVVELREGSGPHTATLSGLGKGRHQLKLFKRSEANAGTVRFRGVAVAQGARVWLPTPASYQVKLEFVGDSITVGACNEDGAADQWDNRRTHNAARSYAALTAAALEAEHRNIAVSGMGVAVGWVEPRAGEIWDRLYPSAQSPRAPLTNWIPDFLFVNLGENDDSFPKAHGQAFPTNYTERYVALVRAIRATYPPARIVLLRGGMFGGAKSEPLRQAWEAAVAELEATDKAISHFAFTHWTGTHPRATDHRLMAEELIAWLREQPFFPAPR